MSKSYLLRFEPSVNPTKFWFCRNRESAWIFDGTAPVNSLCDHLNKGTRVEGVILDTFHVEPTASGHFVMSSETTFEDLERLGVPAHFSWPE